jgi:glycosyltransferase involved in cell wall biosynthesis
MKILMIAPEPFFQPRGTPISVYQRLLALTSLDYQVDLLTYHLGHDVDISGVNIHRIPAIPFINNSKPGPSISKLILDPILFIYAIFMLLTNRYDVIHSHEEASFFSVLLAKLFKKKHLYDMHSSLPKQLTNFKFWNSPLFLKTAEILEEVVLRSADAIITIGSDLDQLVAERHPDVNMIKIENLPLQTVSPTPNADDLEYFRKRFCLNGRQTIVYTGTFEPYQGLDMFIESARIVASEYPEVSFLIVGGNKSQIDQYMRLTAERNMNEFIKFPGKVPVSDAMALLELASVLVSPRLEGTSIPLKVYSYLLSGTPVVATNIEAHRQALDENLAVLTNPNATDFAQGILKLLNDPQLGVHLASNAREFIANNYGFDAYKRKVASIYETLAVPPNAQVGRGVSILNE